MAYQLQSRLGRGGMGVVDLAIGDDGRQVALKRLALHGSSHDMALARLRIRREAEALAQLDHPGIVRLLDVIDDGDDVVLAMPYLSGGTLADQVRAHGPLQPEQVEYLTAALLDALAAAHRQGIVHRDIKPANVLFDAEGRPCLTDFGMATLRDATPGLTASGMVIGTPEFMAPEQARGAPATSASDIFSLGATLRYAATGTPPFGRGDPRVLVQRAARGRIDSWPPGVTPEVRKRLAPLLRRDPARRPTAAAAAGGPAGTTVLPKPHRPRRTLLVVGVMAAALLLAAVVASTIALISRSSNNNAAAAPEAPAPSTNPCRDLPYQPCGQPAAPFTDGQACTDSHADYDGDRTNGCEAAPDGKEGATLGQSLTATLVPTDEIDRYPFHVDDNLQLFCDGTLDVKLTAPVGVSMRLDILQDTQVLGTGVSTSGRPAIVSLTEQNCLGDDAADLTARVSWVGEARSAAPYTLSRSGSF